MTCIIVVRPNSEPIPDLDLALQQEYHEFKVKGESEKFNSVGVRVSLDLHPLQMKFVYLPFNLEFI